MKRPRFVIQERIYWQVDGQTSELAGKPYSRWLKSDDQPYKRSLPVGSEEWTPVETGWVKEIGLLVLRNQDEKETITVSLNGVLCWLFPNESMRLVPKTGVILQAIATGKCRVEVICIPG